jgi:transposase
MVYETATENENQSRNIPWSTRPNRRMEHIYRTGPLAESERREKMVNVGIDLHKTQFTVCVRSQDGDRFGKYPTTAEGYEAFLKETAKWQESGEEVRVGVESTGNTRYFKNRMEEAGIEVKVINTLKMKVVNESVKKTDKHDAATIAEFLEKDMRPESVLCSRTSEQLRRLLKVRTTLVRAEVVIKNQIHALLTAEGMEDVKGSLQSKRGRKRVLDALKQCENGLVAQPLFEMIEQLEGNVKETEGHIREMVKGDRTVELLLTIPGCGEIGAWTIRAYTDDIKRFASAKKYAAYAGLVPWVQDSNETVRHGKITKRGPEGLRTALVQVVMGLRRMKAKTCTWRLMQWYEVMKQYKGSGKTITATARKLAVIIWHMLSEDKEFDLAKMVDRKLGKKAEAMSGMVTLVKEVHVEGRELPVIVRLGTGEEKKTGVARKKKIKVG